jgi:hypothetical protein
MIIGKGKTGVRAVNSDALARILGFVSCRDRIRPEGGDNLTPVISIWIYFPLYRSSPTRILHLDGPSYNTISST